MTEVNPIRDPEPPDLDRLIGAAPTPRDKAYVSTLAKTGMRISEATQLKVTDIDFKRGTLTIVHLKKLAKEVGIPEFWPHLLRHSRCRHLMDEGIPLERVSEIAGHSRLDTTMRLYRRLKAEKIAKLLVDF